jgi:sulfite exporter TauE/SafE
MNALFWGVFTASLLGSTHCAGMCGAFVALAVGSVDLRVEGRPQTSGAARRALLIASYNLGRLVTYCTLGAIAGLIGSAVDLGGSLVGVQRGAAMLAGLFMIGFGVIAMLRLRGVKVATMPMPHGLQRIIAAGHARVATLSPVARAGVIGLLTTLLPCGWLWAFVVTAAGTASPTLGALCMAVFWLGTLPLMASLGAGIGMLTGRLRRQLPMLTSIALVAIGAYTALGRLTLPAIGGITRADESRDALTRVNDLGTGAELPPCCRGENDADGEERRQ